MFRYFYEKWKYFKHIINILLIYKSLDKREEDLGYKCALLPSWVYLIRCKMWGLCVKHGYALTYFLAYFHFFYCKILFPLTKYLIYPGLGLNGTMIYYACLFTAKLEKVTGFCKKISRIRNSYICNSKKSNYLFAIVLPTE